MDRYCNLFSPEQERNGVNLLADQLLGVLCQRLVPAKGGGLRLLVEHMENSGAVRDWIRRRESGHIREHLLRGTDPANAPFLRSAVEACRQGLISESAAIQATGNEAEFKRAMRGVQ
jgi:twitching motility protein PilT